MITVVKPGLLTTVQDLGRFHYQKYGVVVGGALDTFAHRMANLLVGNDEAEATLEITLLGPTLFFEQEGVVAICGGDLLPTIDGTAVASWKAHYVKKGSMVKFGPLRKGCRAYLAISGGFTVPNIMESKSTYLRGKIGGYQGRALRAGDRLAVGNATVSSEKFQKLRNIFISSSYLKQQKVLRLMKGPHFNLFTVKSQTQLWNEPFHVTTQSDRMGYRLQGPSLQKTHQAECLSEAVCFGTLQVPPDGNPIILLADRQPTGGYPVIGQIASIDLPVIAQCKPGDVLSFQEISREEAQRLYLEKEQHIQCIKQGILMKLQEGAE
ncbi:MAG: biotin-dependent carboxyltransferase family protein [Bacillus sp. (in: firmicutes)]